MHLAALLPDPRLRRSKSRVGLDQPSTGATIPPHELRQHYAVDEYKHNGFITYSAAPMAFDDSTQTVGLGELATKEVASRAVLYIPDGDFVDPPTTSAWAFAAELAEAGLRVDVPMTGRLPDYTAADSRPVLEAAYRRLVDAHGAGNVTVIADGSGAASAFGALLPFLPDATPANLILNDPWYDLTPAQWEDAEQMAKLDSIAGYLKEVGHAWAAGAINNAKVNPGVMGSRELTQLQGAKVRIFVGGQAQPLRDARKLKKLLDAAKVSAELTEVKAAVYLFHLRKAKESRQARREMVNICLGQ